MAAALLVVSSTNAQQISEGINNTFFEVSGTSPALDAPVCLRDDSPFIQTSMGCMYYFARHSFSMFYSEFRSDAFYPRAPSELDVQEISYPIIFGAYITNLLCFTMYVGGAVEKTGTCFIGTKSFPAKKSHLKIDSNFPTKTP
jgi:hypothetical protein